MTRLSFQKREISGEYTQLAAENPSGLEEEREPRRLGIPESATEIHPTLGSAVKYRNPQEFSRICRTPPFELRETDVDANVRMVVQ